jgi:spore germination protein GerM
MKSDNKYNTYICFITICALIVSLFLLLPGCSSGIEVKLYFAQYEDNQSFLQPETRTVETGDDIYRSVVEELVKGPESEQLYPTLPSNTLVYSVKSDNGLAIADFSKELITNFEEIPHSSTTEMLAIYSIVNTLTEFDEIERVRITIEGKQNGEVDGLFVEDFWGHVGIYEDFTRNEDIMEKGNIE